MECESCDIYTARGVQPFLMPPTEKTGQRFQGS